MVASFLVHEIRQENHQLRLQNRATFYSLRAFTMLWKPEHTVAWFVVIQRRRQSLLESPPDDNEVIRRHGIEGDSLQTGFFGKFLKYFEVPNAHLRILAPQGCIESFIAFAGEFSISIERTV